MLTCGDGMVALLVLTPCPAGIAGVSGCMLLLVEATACAPPLLLLLLLVARLPEKDTRVTIGPP